MKKALLYLFAFIAVQFVASWLVYAVWIVATGGSLSSVADMFMGRTPVPASSSMLIIASAVYGIALLALFMKSKWAEMSPSYLRSRPWGVLFWASVAAIGTLIPSMWLQEQLPELTDQNKEMFRLIMESRYGYFTLCLFVPFIEEMVFRGAIQRAIQNSLGHKWAAILLSAFIFMLVHYNPAQMPHALLMGILLGWMYSRTGSILPGVALHWINNTAAYAVLAMFPQTADITLLQFFGGSVKHETLAVVFSLLILLPALYQLHVRMKPADK